MHAQHGPSLVRPRSWGEIGKLKALSRTWLEGAGPNDVTASNRVRVPVRYRVQVNLLHWYIYTWWMW